MPKRSFRSRSLTLSEDTGGRLQVLNPPGETIRLLRVQLAVHSGSRTSRWSEQQMLASESGRFEIIR